MAEYALYKNYGQSKKKEVAPEAKAPAKVEQQAEEDKKRKKKYAPVASMAGDTNLTLGVAGKLGEVM